MQPTLYVPRAPSLQEMVGIGRRVAGSSISKVSEGFDLGINASTGTELVRAWRLPKDGELYLVCPTTHAPGGAGQVWYNGVYGNSFLGGAAGGLSRSRWLLMRPGAEIVRTIGYAAAGRTPGGTFYTATGNTLVARDITGASVMLSATPGESGPSNQSSTFCAGGVGSGGVVNLTGGAGGRMVNLTGRPRSGGGGGGCGLLSGGGQGADNGAATGIAPTPPGDGGIGGNCGTDNGVDGNHPVGLGGSIAGVWSRFGLTNTGNHNGSPGCGGGAGGYSNALVGGSGGAGGYGWDLVEFFKLY